MAADSLYALTVLPAGVSAPDLAVTDVTVPSRRADRHRP